MEKDSKGSGTMLFTEWMEAHKEFTGGWGKKKYNDMKSKCEEYRTNSAKPIELKCPVCRKKFSRSIKHIVYKSERRESPDEQKCDKKGEPVKAVVGTVLRTSGLDKIYCRQCTINMAKQVRDNKPIPSPQKSFQDWLDNEGKKYGISAEIPKNVQVDEKTSIGSQKEVNFYCEYCDKEHKNPYERLIKSVCYGKKHWAYLPCCKDRRKRLFGGFTLQDWCLLFWNYTLLQHPKGMPDFNGHLVSDCFQGNKTLMCKEVLYKGSGGKHTYKCTKQEFERGTREITEKLIWCKEECDGCNAIIDKDNEEMDEYQITAIVQTIDMLGEEGLGITEADAIDEKIDVKDYDKLRELYIKTFGKKRFQAFESSKTVKQKIKKLEEMEKKELEALGENPTEEAIQKVSKTYKERYKVYMTTLLKIPLKYAEKAKEYPKVVEKFRQGLAEVGEGDTPNSSSEDNIDRAFIQTTLERSLVFQKKLTYILLKTIAWDGEGEFSIDKDDE